jgi:hypothetical protein
MVFIVCFFTGKSLLTCTLEENVELIIATLFDLLGDYVLILLGQHESFF